MLAYRNGKSAGRVSVANWHGPHRFTGNYHVVPVEQARADAFAHPRSDRPKQCAATLTECGPAQACVLHFESCTYEQWRNKFIKHREMDEQKKVETMVIITSRISDESSCSSTVIAILPSP